MITKFKIFEMFSLETNDCDRVDISILLKNNSIKLEIKDIMFEEDVDKIEGFDIDQYKQELKSTINNAIKDKLDITSLLNIDSTKFNLFCYFVSDNLILNKHYNVLVFNELIKLKFDSVMVGDFIDVIEHEFSDFKEKNNSYFIEQVILNNLHNNDIIDKFFFKGLFNSCSKEFKEKHKYIFDAKNFDLL